MNHSQLQSNAASQAKQDRMSLLIVVLNYRTPELTVACLRSVAKEVEQGVPACVVVVDNDSGDNSINQIRVAIVDENWHEWCSLVPSQENLGFAGGNNLGVRWALNRHDSLGVNLPDFILLLNSDTIVHQGCLQACMRTLEKDGRVGALTCRLLNADGSLQVVCRKFPSPLRLIVGATGLPWKLPKFFSWADTEYQSWDMDNEPGSPDWIGGAFMMLRRETVEQVGLLDENFFFYGEDVEYCYRIRRGGWEISYEPTVTTTHFGGSSSDPTRMLDQAKSIARWRARYLFLRKSYGRIAMWSVRGVDIMAIAFRALLLKVTGRSETPHAESLKSAFRTLTRSLGAL